MGGIEKIVGTSVFGTLIRILMMMTMMTKKKDMSPPLVLQREILILVTIGFEDNSPESI